MLKLIKRRLLIEKNGFSSEYKAFYLYLEKETPKPGHLSLKLGYKIIPAELKDKFMKEFIIDKLSRYIPKNNELCFNLTNRNYGFGELDRFNTGFYIDNFLKENLYE